MPAYLDHAASTPLRPEAREAMSPYLTEVFANPTGGHRAAQRAKSALEESRERVASILRCAPDEVVFTGGGSEGDNLAVKGAAWAARDASPELDGVVVTAFEHKAVLAAADRLERQGFRVARVGVTSAGLVDVDQLADALDERTAVASVMLVNNEVGTCQPFDAVASVVAERAPNAVLHTDAVQGPQWVDVGAATSDAHLVATSGHKFGGPKGVGALVVRRGTDLVPLVEGAHEWGLRGGTQDVAGIVGFATALAVTHDRREAECEAIAAHRDRLEAALLEVPATHLNGDPAVRVEGALHLAFDDVESEALLVALDQADIYAAAGSSCSSGATEPSYVLVAMGLPRERAVGSVRLSLGYATRSDEIDHAIATIPAAVARLREARVAAV